jgi:hypothetical protein
MSAWNFAQAPLLAAENLSGETNRNWYAVYTMPRGEQSMAKHLEMCQIESFCPHAKAYTSGKTGSA